MKIRFFGDERTITGSGHLLEAGGLRILLDCGMFQGDEDLEERNAEPFPFDPTGVDCVLLTHSHIDHSGRIPYLIQSGFQGPIYCTKATGDLTDLMLQDSGNIQEKDAEFLNQKGILRKGKPAVPLYTQEEGEAAKEHFRIVSYGERFFLGEGVSVRYQDAGHILGSSILEIWVEEEGTQRKLVYSGDLGFRDKDIIQDPTLIEEADVLLMETTYGNRLHTPYEESLEEFIRIILETTGRGGTVVIPSFAVGRTQELIYELEKLYEDRVEYRNALRGVGVYVDSPLASKVTRVFLENPEYFDEEILGRMAKGNAPLLFEGLHFTHSTEESKALNFDPKPKIIIASSGMCTAGRIRHHLMHHLGNPNSSILFVGYQGEGTLGREIAQGADFVELFGRRIRVRAKVHVLEGFSAHGDQKYLLEWLKGFRKAPKRIFLVHGEQEAKEAFSRLVKSELNLECTIVEGTADYDL